MIAVPPTTSHWIDDDGTASEDGSAFSGGVKMLSFATPIASPDASEATSYCGNAYFTDIHVGGGQALQETGADGSSGPAAVPGACDGGPMTPEEEALEFLLFNQVICVHDETAPGYSPPVRP